MYTHTQAIRQYRIGICCRLRACIVKFAVIIALAFVYTPTYAQINAEQAVTVGRNSMYFEDYMLAIQYFNRAISAKPYLALPYFYRAVAKFNLEDYRGAAEDAGRAIELNPFLSDAWEVRGVARQNYNDNAGAVSDYDHALALLPRNRQIMFNKAMAQTALKEYAAADSTFGELLEHYPRFESAYLGRARERLEAPGADTIVAIQDIKKALEINPNSFNGHAMAAELAMRRGAAYNDTAMYHLEKAIKLRPNTAGLYINRAYLKYNNDDYDGALDDFDHAIALEPYNTVALFNRGLLETEVSDYDKARADFDRVLSLEPENIRARYQRAYINGQQRRYDKAIEDINYVIKAFPDFPSGLYMRSEFYRHNGNAQRAAADYNRAVALSRKLRPDAQGKVESDYTPTELSDDEVARRRFATLLTVEQQQPIDAEYNNPDIRGKVQDRNISIEPQGWVEISYYNAPTELQTTTYFMKDVDMLNATGALRYKVMVTSNVPGSLDDALSQRHFTSIEDYTSYMATHTPRAVDFIGRAMDYLTLRDYDAAIKDLDRAIALKDDYALVYLLRAQARHHKLSLPTGDKESTDATARAALRRATYDEILSDLNNALRFDPTNAFVWYDKACLYIELELDNEALEAINRAIELKNDFGEAFFNRGYLYMRMGNTTAGAADLGRAGELGVPGAYNLLKRLTQ